MIQQNQKNDKIPTQNIPSFIQKDEETIVQEMVNEAERLGRRFAQENKVTTSQIRNIYGTVKKLEMRGWDIQTKRQLLLLKPRLAYAAGRHGGGVVELKDIISIAIDHVNNEADFKRFCQFFEAILAYHKAHGGK